MTQLIDQTRPMHSRALPLERAQPMHARARGGRTLRHSSMYHVTVACISSSAPSLLVGDQAGNSFYSSQ